MIQSSASLDAVKKNVVNFILDDKVKKGEISTQEEYDLEYNMMMDKIKNNQLISNPKYQSGKSDADNFNSDVENLYIDLLTTFGYVNNLDQTISKHLKINESVISNLKLQVSQINDNVINLENMVMQQWSSNNFIEAFRNTDNFEEDANLYTDRYGDPVSKEYMVSIDRYSEAITLPYISKNNILIGSNGVSFANIKIIKQLGKDTITMKNPNSGLEKAIDTSLETYWSETIMCDTPMKMAMNDYYYDIGSGALCELELEFDSIMLVNEITLLPYSKYPMEVVAIRYYTSDDDEEGITEIVSPHSKNPVLKNKLMERQTTFKFPNILCKRVRILLRQLHYIKSNVITSAEDASKNQIWFSTGGDNSVDIQGDSIFKPLYQEKGFLDRAWVMLNKVFKKSDELTLNNILAKNETKIMMNKYEYNYGLYNIGMFFNDFQNMGIFISKPIDANGNVKSLSMIATEFCQDVDYIVHDVEYYISYKENPKARDWLPIFPKNFDSIKCERLIASPGTFNKFFLRFPAKGTVIVKDNLNRTLNQSLDYNPIIDSNGKIIGIDMFFPNTNLIYTAEYTPIDECKVIDFITGEMVQPIVEREIIKGNNTNYYAIQNLPYIIRPTRIKITDSKGKVIDQNTGDIQCITDIYSPSESYKHFNNDKFQYYVDGKYIYFNKNIDSESTIEFTYQHYISNVRVKAILRRNSNEDNWLTPIVDNIELNFNTMD